MEEEEGGRGGEVGGSPSGLVDQFYTIYTNRFPDGERLFKGWKSISSARKFDISS